MTFEPKSLQLGRPDLHKMPFRSRGVSKYTNHTFLTNCWKSTPTEHHLTANVSPIPLKHAPQSPKVLPKAPLGDHFGVIFKTFCMTWAQDLSMLLVASNFEPKTTLQTPESIKFM